MTFKIFSRVPRESRRIYMYAICLTALISGVFQANSNKEFGVFLNKQIFYPFVFSLKSRLIDESLDPRLKIFAYDDSTVAYKKSTDLTLPEWADVLTGLAAPGDVRILVDKLFDAYHPIESVKIFASKLKTLGDHSKISAITFAHTDRIRFRSDIDPDIVTSLQSKVFAPEMSDPLIPQGFGDMTLYGAIPEVIKNFHRFGFANYRGDGFIAPIARLKSNQMVPHAALSLFDPIDISHEKLKIAGKQIPTNQDGRVLVNFFKPDIYRKSTLSMVALIARIQSGMDLSIVKPGDIVLILPAMFTGHTDFVESPFGPIPGGFHLVSVVNSILTDNWIRVVDDSGFFVLLCAFFGLALNLILRPSLGTMATLLTSIAIVTVSAGLFIYAKIAISFVLPIAGFLLGSFCGISLKVHSTALDEARKNRELEVASLVQRSFFQSGEPTTRDGSSCKAVGITESASECGGDWWGSLRKNNYNYHFIADAIGHGVPAALITSVAYSVSKAMELEISKALETLLPSDILTMINQVLVSLGSRLRHMTFFIVRIDDKTGECVYANAGNPQGYLLRKASIGVDGKSSERPKQLAAIGNVLGDEAGSSYENHSVTLEDGDKIILFTDGIFENRTADERSQLGKPWLRQTIQRHAGRPIDDFTSSVWRHYKFATGSTPPDDDASLLVIEFDRKKMKNPTS